MDAYLLDQNQLKRLLERLKQEGTLLAPQIDRGVIAYGPLESFEDLPLGWSELQGPGLYRLKKTGTDAIFSYRVAPTSWKSHLYPPKELLFTARKDAGGVQINPAPEPQENLVLFGVRPCELRAIRVQERALSKAQYDPYQKRLARSLIVAVDCVEPGENCFCADLGSGPEAQDACDLKLTEWGRPAKYLLQAGSSKGRKILASLDFPPAPQEAIQQAQDALDEAQQKMGRSLKLQNDESLLAQKHDHPAFEAVAERCTACGNCTLVCPTCFCSTLEDHTSLDGTQATRHRSWDSCFNLDFTYIHGGHTRERPAERYRQWLTHKLSSWQAQFDQYGCVGCGRCITWCPEGIDLTEEYKKLHQRQTTSLIEYRELT